MNECTKMSKSQKKSRARAGMVAPPRLSPTNDELAQAIFGPLEPTQFERIAQRLNA